MSAEARRLDAVTAQSSLHDLAIRVDPTVDFQVPRDAYADAALAAVDMLLDQGQSLLALGRATAIELGQTAVAVPYEFLRAERVGRAQLAIGDDHFLSGNRDEAHRAYQAIWAAEPSHPAVRGIAALAREHIDSLVSERRRLIDEIGESARLGTFDRWCDQHSRLREMTILSAERLWGQIETDGHALIQTRLDPQAMQVIAPPSALPGSVFRLTADVALPAIALRVDAAGGTRVPAALARPVIETMITARTRLLAIERGLTLTGETATATPVFRYAYLRDRAHALIDQIVRLDGRTEAVETRLDDLNAVFVRISSEVERTKDEMAANKRNIERIEKELVKQQQLELAAQQVSKALEAKAADCETEWWSWAVSGVLFITAQALGIGLLFGDSSQSGLATILREADLGESAALASLLGGKAISCADVEKAQKERDAAMRDLATAQKSTKDELEHLMLERDRQLTAMKSLDEQRAQARQQDATRALDTVTLGMLRSHYGRIRDDLVTRARAVSKLAETAFNFEEDAGLQPIQTDYSAPSRKGYGAGETLRADLHRLEQFHLTTRRTKRLQLSHVISLRQQCPMAFVAIRATGSGRVAIDMADVDRAFPGTYLQRIREVRVEVLTAAGPVAARGYLSNEGLSSVRFQDRGDRSPWLGAEVTPDPDPAIAALCFKHARQRQSPETAAFPDFESHLAVDRSVQTQRVERNFFEHLGVETTWTIELLPDQPFDVSAIVDVRLHVQFDAFFDGLLKGILDRKRYGNRRETASLSIRELAADPAADLFTHSLTVLVRRDRLPVPNLDKRITEVGFVIKPRQARVLDGVATLTASIDGSAAALLVTDTAGIVATAQIIPAGGGIAALALAARGKSVHAPWTIELVDLPAGLGKTDVEDVFLLVEYEYVTS